MGIGKLRGPGSQRSAGENGDSEADEGTDDARQPLSIAEIVSDLTYAGKPLSEIAGYDDLQLRWIIFRARDKHGRLIRKTKDLPDWVEVDEEGQRIISNPKPFEFMFRQVQLNRGKSREEADKDWQGFLAENPKLGKGGPN